MLALAAESGVPPGRHLLLAAISEWTGLRPSTELWATAVALSDSGAEHSEAISAAFLAAVAAGTLGIAGSVSARDVQPALRSADRALTRRRDAEDQRRREDNEATIEVRRTSLTQSHQRKVRQVEAAIATLTANGKDRMVALQRTQIKASERRLQDALRQLEESQDCSLALEHLAVCVVEVRHVDV
jgi:hypothetical protein